MHSTADSPRKIRIGVLAGEASGDILGSRVLAALRQRYPDMIVEGIGGPLMAEQGLCSMFPMERLSVMGFVEPLKRLPELLTIRGTVFQHFVDNPPDLFLGIDAPDFNLHLEQKLRAKGIKTAHLVSPTVWAWRKGRVRKIAKAVDLMLCLFPFETEIYGQHNVKAEFVGHPLADELADEVSVVAAREQLGLPAEGKLVALLPGSRGGEVRLLAPLLLQTAQRLQAENTDLHFVMPAANAQRHSELSELLRAYPELSLSLVDGQSRQAMAAADLVLLASGTATLEALLLKRPMVITYKLAPLSWWLVSRLVTTAFAGLPNVLAGRSLVPEFIQQDARPANLADSVGDLLENQSSRDQQLQAFDDIAQSLRLGFGERCADALSRLM